MNISFHYYAVKTIALKAGLNEKTSQLLASYSQFVDDYDIYKSRRLESVPPFAQSLAKKCTILRGWDFYPVTTGFNSLLDMTRLLTEEHQTLITVPFHFIPQVSLNNYFNYSWTGLSLKAGVSRAELRTVAERNYKTSSSLIAFLMRDAIEHFKAKPDTSTMVMIGILLHVWADTFAHQNFSGFYGWENDCQVKWVGDFDTGMVVTSKYSGYRAVPNIGHARAYHAPDDPFVQFELLLKPSESGRCDMEYARSNGYEFGLASRAIYDFLCDCFLLPKMTEREWTEFSGELHTALRLSNGERDLNRVWYEQFFSRGYYYFYDKDSMYPLREVVDDQNEIQTNLSDEQLIQDILYNPNSEHKNTLLEVTDENFFYFNMHAKYIRDVVNHRVTPIKASYQ